ncbi:TylF/MycF/NovP-related O-methyltransferase [Chelatococcus asaccharovorans]|uniref:Macrocin-O-methyltransferase TylF n=2 Tax=Chelatococcus asaccharovorans TaxID=28210 RepID=A0A2V3U1U5_9HYPH|nr:TylF/MycF/NovP-related O-methyltransferase [Chelatococcus asaccharovorans]MBS7704350.1 hypothetical protein [Chelatococcus asaccharovorans]PXW55772.1 macrocin-O-methyltransferase TylF [Chelatococcus asaccharovorans]
MSSAADTVPVKVDIDRLAAEAVSRLGPPTKKLVSRLTPVAPIPGEGGREAMKRIPEMHIDDFYVHEQRFTSFKLISAYAAMPFVSLKGDFAEFGVFKGRCARFITQFVPKGRRFHLFDSFEGLPEAWAGAWAKGHFDLKGNVPKLDPEVCRVYKGWFKDTVPIFAQAHENPLSFIHMDADLYSSTIDVLYPINTLIVPGTIILFDEYVMNKEEDEHRALMDWAKEYDRSFEYLFKTRWVQVAIRITK